MAAVTPDDFSRSASLPGDLTSMRERLTARLENLRSRLRWQIGLEGLARMLVTLTGLMLLGLVLDMWFELSIVARVLFLSVIGATLAVLAWRYLYRPLRAPWGPIELAAALDDVSRRSAKHAIAPRVATVLQLPALSDLEWRPSRAMIEQAVRRSFAWLETTNFLDFVNRRHLNYCLMAVAGSAVFPALMAAGFPTTARLWADRWLFGSETPWPRYTTISVLGEQDGRLIVPRGEASLLRVAVTDLRAPTETVWMRQEKADGSSETFVLESYGGGEFRRELPPLDEPIKLQLWGGDGRTGPILVEPLDRPRINELKLVYRSPRDASPQVHDFSGEDSNLALFTRTDVELTLIANVPIEKVEIATESPALRPFERVDEQTFKTTWKHDEAVRMRVMLTATDSGLISHPRPIAVGLKGDQPPNVSLSHSGVGSRITAVATIPLKVLARDDLGLTSVVLHGESNPGSAGSVPPPATSAPSNGPAANGTPTPTAENNGAVVAPESNAATPKSPAPALPGAPPSLIALFGPNPPTPETSVEQPHDWELEPLHLRPGDTVRFFAEATDDCHLGAQISRSRTVAFRVVAAEELFREILIRQQQMRARLRKATEEAEGLRDQFRIAELPQQAGDLLRRHRLIQREVWQVHRSLGDSATEMRLNRLGGPETHELLTRQIIEPLGRVHDELLSAQRQAVESLGRTDAEPLDQTVQRQEEILTKLNGILANMRQWDSFVDVVNQLNSVIKLEERIRDKTEELRKSQFDSIFEK